MRNYIIRRLFHACLVIFVISILVFLAIEASGDPAALLAPMDALPSEVEALRESMGLNKPIYVRYIGFWEELLSGNLKSFRYKRPPAELLIPHIYNSLKLNIPALIIGAMISLPLGIIAANKRGSFYDGIILSGALIGQAIPIFLLGVLLIWLFAVILGWLPVSGQGSIKNFILPVASLTAFNVAILVRMTRATVIEVLEKDYVRTARAKGLVEYKVILKHAFRNALVPIVSLMGLQIGTLLSGALVVEWIFAWPGIGKLLYDSIIQRDMPLIMVGTLTIAGSVALLNLFVDLLYAFLDPRIVYE